MSLLDRCSRLFGETEDERLASDPLVLDTGTAGAAPVVPEADELTAPDLRARAEEFADRNERTGLGFTLDSLARLDDVAVEQRTVLASLDGVTTENRRPSAEPGGRVLDFGCYAGEVLVAEFDGEWVDDDGWGVAVPVAGETVVVPLFDLAARAVGGDPRFYEVGSGLDEGQIPRPMAAKTAGVRTAMAAATLEVTAYWDAYDLDVTPGSLARLDELIDAEWDVARFRSARFGDGDVDSRIYTELVRHFGSYYGEVLIRQFDAEWTSDPDLGTVVDVRGQGGAAVANVFVVAANRLTDEERFALDVDVLAANLDLDVSPVSEQGYEIVRSDPDALDAVRHRKPDAIAAVFAENAATLAGEWPNYGLDYTPASLQRLDALSAREFDQFDLASADLDGATDADSLVLTARAMEAGGYLAAVFRREIGGDWRSDDLAFVVQGRSVEATLDPVGIAASCLRGEGSFAATYRAIDDRLEAPVDAPAGAPAEASTVGAPTGASVDAPTGMTDGDAMTGETDGGTTAWTPEGHSTGETAEPVSARDASAAASGSGAAARTGADHTSTGTDGGITAAEVRHDAVAVLGAEWPDYALDGSVESLVELDALVAAEFDRSDGGRDYDGDPLAVSSQVVSSDAVNRVGAYFGELLSRHHDAEWREDSIVVSGASGGTDLEPERLAAACFAGESSFLDAYAHLAARVGLDTPLGDD